jgi:ankyrin repeat protein
MLTKRDCHHRSVRLAQLTSLCVAVTALLTAVVQCCSYICTQVRELLADTELDCCNVHEAAQRGHLGCLKLLLSRSEQSGLSFNDQHLTPLLLVRHNSSSSICCELTAALLSSASSAYVTTVINAADTTGETALHKTVHSSTHGLVVCHSCARALLQAGAAAGAVSKSGKAALTVADVLKDADVRARVTGGDSPPEVREQVLTLQALQQCGVDVTGCEHLHAAAAAAATQAPHSCAGVRALLACGADPHKLDSRGYTALHSAAAARNCASKGIATRVSAASTVKVMQLMVAHCAEQDGFGQELLNATTPEGRTALHLSANHAAVVAALLELGAEMDAVDDSNITPLHLACFELSAAESVRELLRRGASTRAHTMPLRGHADEGCWLPVHMAAVYGSRRICSWLGTTTTKLLCDVLDALLASDDCLNEQTTAGCTAV